MDRCSFFGTPCSREEALSFWSDYDFVQNLVHIHYMLLHDSTKSIMMLITIFSIIVFCSLDIILHIAHNICYKLVRTLVLLQEMFQIYETLRNTFWDINSEFE